MPSYLTFSILLTLLGIVLIRLATGQKRSFVVWSAVFAAPTGLADFWFAPAYWQPDHIFGPVFSIEGMLFSFGNGAILGFLVWPFFRNLLTDRGGPGHFFNYWTQFVIATLPGFLVFLALWDGLAGPLPVMQASFAGFVTLCLWLGMRGQINPVAGIISGAIFAAAYWSQIMLWHAFDNDLSAFWPSKTVYLAQALPITGLPGDELIWAAFYGLLWPHIIVAALGSGVSTGSGLFRKLT